jgi:copper(I)-binding protein
VRELLRAAAGPVICAVLLVGLLAGWTATGGAGTITRARLQVTLAAVPMRAFTPAAAAKVGAAHVYLDIRNLSATPDELLAVRSPVATHIVLTERTGPAAKPTVVTSLTIPGQSTLSLSPLGNGVVLKNPVPFESSGDVPLTLVFRHAGQVTIDAPVTPPGTPLRSQG